MARSVTPSIVLAGIVVLLAALNFSSQRLQRPRPRAVNGSMRLPWSSGVRADPVWDLDCAQYRQLLDSSFDHDSMPVVPGLGSTSFAHLERVHVVLYVSAGMTLHALSAIASFVVGRIWKWRIDQPSIVRGDDRRAFGFSLKYLLVVLTVCALLLGAFTKLKFRAEMPLLFNIFGVDFAVWVTYLGGAIVSAILLPIIAAPVLVLRPKPSIRAIQIAILISYVVTTFAAGILSYIELDDESPLDVLLYILLLQFAALATSLVTTLPMRSAGFRLIRVFPSDLLIAKLISRLS